MKNEMKKQIDERTGRHLRAALCALLLTLLAVCGYAGASRGGVRAVSVPVVYSTLETGAASGTKTSPEAIRARLSEQRRQEMELLESVIDGDAADEATRTSALAQRTELARRMECEASAEAVLEGMGFSGAISVCGAQVMTLILRQEQAQTQADRLRALDAVSAQTGTAAEEIKIILAKNE